MDWTEIVILTLMDIDENMFLTVKEAAGLTGKSVSTIKRFANNNKRYRKHFRYETLPTGHQKIFISKAFIETSFQIDSTSISKKRTLESTSANPLFVDYLLSEIAKKDEELKAKDRRIDSLLDRLMSN